MSLSAGAKLGPYEILSPLGAGGMGEVYRARDTRLGRDVAIKVLPQHLSSSPDLKQRFEREAKAISSLQHPHICTLFDVGSQDGTDFLVMEYLEGETLADRLIKGALPLEQVLKIGIEIAAALDKAHRQGIVHRDLKPGNVMLTKSGAKLMDFGLAKPAMVLGLGATAGPLTPSTPTMSVAALTSPASPLTQKGQLVGTFQYMAPEVLQGAEADARSDLFSFGCVLYEMVAGRRAFEGKSQLGVMTAILEKEPEPIVNLQSPPILQRLIQGCLAKDPQERLQTAHDVALQLRWFDEPGEAKAQPAPQNRLIPTLLAVALVLVFLLAAAAYWMYATRPTAVSLQASIDPGKLIFDIMGDDSGPPALSPDGRMLVFRAHAAGSAAALWIRHMDSGAMQRLDGTEYAQFPFWSPDSRNLAFFSQGKLDRLSIAGGTVTQIAAAPDGRGGDWGAGDTIVFAPDFQTSIFAVNGAGGEAKPVTTLDRARHTTHRWPQLLPDGTHLLYFATSHSGGDASQNGVYWASLDGKDHHMIVASETGGMYASGNLLFVSHGTLRAQPFNPSTGQLSGAAATLSDDVAVDSGTWHAAFTASRNGLLVFAHAGAQSGTTLSWFDTSGKSSPTDAAPGKYDSTRLSPDGRRVAVTISDPFSDVWILDLQRGTPTRLTFDAGNHFFPVWSPDGKRIAYTVGRGKGVGLFFTPIVLRNVDGSGSDEHLLEGDPAASYALQDWTARYIVFIRNTGPQGHSVWALPLTGDRKPFQVLAPPSPQASIDEAHVSPDGRWLAYSSNESGRREIYVTTFPTASGKWQISNGGGNHDVWSHDGHTLFFSSPYDGMLRSVAVRTAGGEFLSDSPRSLFSLTQATLGLSWDVSPDGKRFLVGMSPEQSSQPLTLVSNWTTQVKKP